MDPSSVKLGDPDGSWLPAVAVWPEAEGRKVKSNFISIVGATGRSIEDLKKRDLLPLLHSLRSLCLPH